ncbi:MAG: DUF5667 domain-containing protein [Actinomycetales bacterium]
MSAARDLLSDTLLHPGRAQAFDQALDRASTTGRLPNDEELAALVGMARALPESLAAATPDGPRPEFRAALRERLLVAAAEQPAAPVTVRRRRAVAPVRPARRGLPRGARIGAGALALALVGGVATAAASNNALPGDALYGLKRGIERMHLGLMQDDASRGQEQLAEAQTRLVELRHLLSGSQAAEPETTELARDTFADLQSSATSGAAALVRAYDVVGSTIPLRELDADLSSLSEGLRDVTPLLPADLRGPARTLAERLASVDARVHDMLATCASPCDTIPRTGASSTLPRITLPFDGLAQLSGTTRQPSGVGGGTGGGAGGLPAVGVVTSGATAMPTAGAGTPLPGLPGAARSDAQGASGARGSQQLPLPVGVVTSGVTSAGGLVSSGVGAVTSAGGGVLTSAGGAVSSAVGAATSPVGAVTSPGAVVSSIGGAVTSAGGVVSSGVGAVTSGAGQLTSGVGDLLTGGASSPTGGVSFGTGLPRLP